jgi:hypothetical protein
MIMKHLKLCSMLLIGALALTLAGCCCGGTDTETKIIEKQPVSTAPLGEELIKLKEAHEKGAMSDEEYEAAKKNLLKE